MAHYLPAGGDNRMTLDAFMDRVEQTLDLQDADSLIGLASDFQCLSNDPDIVSTHLNKVILQLVDNVDVEVAEPVMLGRGEGFCVRASVWSPGCVGEPAANNESVDFDRHAHNHNVNVMTVGYLGPGSTTDVYTLKTRDLKGEVGERVELQFDKRKTLSKGAVMIYRHTVDVHAHLPPTALSISLSLSVTDVRSSSIDQYLFDTQTSTISGFVNNAILYRRAAVVRLAGEIGNEETLTYLDALVRRSNCRRMREAAIYSASRLEMATPSKRAIVVERGLRDSDAMIRGQCEVLMEKLTGTKKRAARPR